MKWFHVGFWNTRKNILLSKATFLGAVIQISVESTEILSVNERIAF